MKSKFTDQEKRDIINNCKEMTVEQLTQFTPGRSKSSVAMFLRRNKLKAKKAKAEPLSEADKNYIRENHKTMNIHKMSLVLKKGFNVIDHFMKKNNLEKYSNYRQRDEPRDIIRYTPPVEVKKSFTRPPAVYSNTDWSKKYLT